MRCTECGENLTRPSPLSQRTQICKQCRRRIKLNEQQKMKELALIKTEDPIYEKEETMEKIETVIHEPPEKQEGTLAEMRMEKRDRGIYVYFKSPMLQNFMINTVSSSFNLESTDNMIPVDEKEPRYSYTYGWKNEFATQYKGLAQLNPTNPLIASNGVVNLGFFYLANKVKNSSSFASGITSPREAIDPTKPIEFYYTGVQTNEQLDQYIAKIKEIVYKIYADNMATYNKRLIINFSEEDVYEKQSTQDTKN